MFTIVLMNKNNDIPLKKAFSKTNDYLSKEDTDDEMTYKLLSQISKVDICVFPSNKMTELIKELADIQVDLNNFEKKHIDEVLKLAELCSLDSNLVLGITPFSTFLNDEELKMVIEKGN